MHILVLNCVVIADLDKNLDRDCLNAYANNIQKRS